MLGHLQTKLHQLVQIVSDPSVYFVTVVMVIGVYIIFIILLSMILVVLWLLFTLKKKQFNNEEHIKKIENQHLNGAQVSSEAW